MKRPVKVCAAVCVLFITVFLAAGPVIRALVRRQLEQVFVQGQVSVARCALRPAGQVSLFDIRIKQQAGYEIKVSEAAVSFSFSSLLKPHPFSLSLKGVHILLVDPRHTIRESARFLRQRPEGPLLFGDIEIVDSSLDVKTLDCGLKAAFSLRFNAVRQSVDYLDARLDSFMLLGLQLKDGVFRSSGSLAPGEFSIAQLTYNKLNVTGIKGKIRFSPQGCAFNGVTAKMAQGDLGVDADLSIGKDLRYALHLTCAGLDIGQFVHDFDLQKKFTMTGKVSGSLKLQGAGNNIEILGGDLSTLRPGGTLIITDTKFLENMAVSTKQPVDLLVESFKNYSYNTGLMSIGIQGRDVILGVVLEGPAGKRDFTVVLHKFSTGRQKE